MDPQIPNPISSVYQKNVKLQNNSDRSLLESDPILLNSIKACLGIKLIHQYSSLSDIITRREIVDELKEIKRMVSSISVEGHSILLNSEWHQTLFRSTECGRDQLLWDYVLDLTCIYEGEHYVSHEYLTEQIISHKPKFILISDNNGPCILWCILCRHELIITFPIFAVRIVEPMDTGISVVISSLLTDKKYDLTGYYLRS